MFINIFQTRLMSEIHAMSFFWFRRDLRLNDNTALWHALKNERNVALLFIFDTNIIDELPRDDARISFIYDCLEKINSKLIKKGSSLIVKSGKPLSVWKELTEMYQIDNVYINKDYEPYAIQRDSEIDAFLTLKGISLHSYKDQVVFEPDEILNNQGSPYSVFTPYKNKWLYELGKKKFLPYNNPNFGNLIKMKNTFPSLRTLGFSHTSQKVLEYDLSKLRDYAVGREYPARRATSLLGPHLRFGTVGIREILIKLSNTDLVFLGELIWREFFKQILFHYPEVVTNNFNRKYNEIAWRNNEKEFDAWCRGQTGYPLVDAGMRQLNTTGYMHNRVRMVTASFLCKHLLIDWRWGEAYFARKLLDYDLSSNNGNWQWAAGTGSDAAPYFRVFNPEAQMKKFDKAGTYVKKWVPEYGTSSYIAPIIDHSEARNRAISTYRYALHQHEH
jgi:deoxyribodipyrimidine photo-lyase